MAAFGKVHPQHGIAGLEQGKVHRQVGLSAGVGLHVGVVRAEQLAGPLPGDLFHDVHALAAAIVPLAGIPFGVLVGEHRPHSRHHSGGNDILRSDQLQVAPLAGKLLFHSLSHFGVFFFHKADGIHQIIEHSVRLPFSSKLTNARAWPAFFLLPII